MLSETARWSRVSIRLTLLGCLALGSLMWAGWTWTRLSRTERYIAREGAEIPDMTAGAGEILAARAQAGGTAGPDTAPPQDLISFFETVAARAGIARESLAINTDNPRPAAGRPDLVDEETRIDLKSVSVRSLVQFLGTMEKTSSALVVREIGMTPLPETNEWAAHVRISALKPARP